MKKFKQFMTIFLANVMCLSNVLSVSATDSSEDGTTSSLRAPVEGTVILEEDFEEASYKFAKAQTGSGDTDNKVNFISDTDSTSSHGTIVEMVRGSNNTGEFRIQAMFPTDTSKLNASSIVYEFDVKLVSTTGNVRLLLRDASSNVSCVCRIVDGWLIAGTGGGVNDNQTKIKQLDKDTWYTISVVQDYANNVRKIYVDGTREQENTTFGLETYFSGDNVVGATDIKYIRFYSHGGTGDDVMFDNIKVYEGTVPLTDDSNTDSGSDSDSDTDSDTDTDPEPEGISSYLVKGPTDVTSEGYIGIPVQYSVYYDSSKGTVKNGTGLDATQIAVYVVNTQVERIGTETDEAIIKDMLERGLIVVVLDYLNNEKAVSPDLDWSVQAVRANVTNGSWFSGIEGFPSGSYYQNLVVPAGYNVEFNKVFWEIDKHGADGTFDKIVEIWNNDFRAAFGDTIVKWVNEDGNRKSTQAGFDESEPVWLDEDGTENADSGQYIKIKYTKAESITDCVKADGTPIDLNLYMHIIYPTNPSYEVPVMVLACSSEHLASGTQTADRPQLNGALFNGYAGVTFEYGYTPMARADHYGYFDGNTSEDGTGDNLSYSIHWYNEAKINTAAMRYLRYLAASEPTKYQFDDEAIGVYGNSKGGWMTSLGEEHPELLPERRMVIGHSGETRYENGDTTTVGVINGGEVQPWLTYGGNSLDSGADFIYASCGGASEMITAGHAPTFISCNYGDSTYWAQSNYFVNFCRRMDVPTLWFEISKGHTLAYGKDMNYGVDTYQAFFTFANYYLKHDAVEVIYADWDDEVDNAPIVVKFSGAVAESELSAITVKDADGNSVQGIWSSQFGNTEWTFTMETLKGSTEYTLTVPAGIKGDNDKGMSEAFTYTFTTEAAVITTVQSLATSAGTYYYFTMPTAADDVNVYNLRVNVTNDAVNTLEIYALTNFDSSTPDNATVGDILMKVPVSGAGYYDFELGEYLADKTAGTTVAFLVKQGKTAGETVIFDSSTAGFGNFSSGWLISKTTAEKDGKAAITVTDIKQYPKYTNNTFYPNPQEIATTSALIKSSSLTADDLGRRFNISLKIYDTESRPVSLKLNSCTDSTSKTADYNAYYYNILTKADEWIEFNFDYTVYEPELGDVGLQTKTFTISFTHTGEAEANDIYIADIVSKEIVTDVTLAGAELILSQEEETEEEENPLETPYGTIPEAYASVEAYPFVRFQVNSDGTYTFKAAAADIFADNASLMTASRGTASVIYMRRDFTNVAIHGNLCHIQKDFTLDLGGHTLTLKYSAYETNPKKNSYTTNAVIKNGTVVVDTAPFMYFKASQQPDSEIEDQVFNITFKDIAFKIAEGATSKYIGAQYCNNKSSITRTYQANVTYEDCTFDFSAGVPSGGAVLFESGSADKYATATVKVKGGKIILPTMDNVKLVSLNNDASTVLFGKGSDDIYPMILLPADASAPTEVIACTGGTISYVTTDTAGEYIITPLEDETVDDDTDDDTDTTITLRDPIEGMKIYATDFELHNPFSAVTSGGAGTITRVTEDEEHGYVMEFQRLTSGDLRLDPSASTFCTDASSVVYEFDVKLLDLEATGFHLLLRKTDCSYGYVCTISNGRVLGYRGTADSQVTTLNADTWYTISIVQNYKTMYRDIYVDGVKVSTDNTLAIESDFATGTTDLDRVKFECGSTTDYFRLDNVRVYEGTEPYIGELLEPEVDEVEIVIDPTKSVFELEKYKNLWGNKYLDTLLEGYVSLHTRSGVVYKDGEKTVLATTPVETQSGYQVVLSEICDALGLTYTIDGNVATISDTEGSIQNKTVTVSESDGKVWVDAKEFLGIYGTVSIDTNETIKSNGMMIAGVSAFEWPSAEDTAGSELKTLGSRSMLQNLNEYLFLEQPTADEIKALYNASKVAGQHPRIQATKDDFDRIKSEITTNELMNTWYQQLIAAADYLVNTNTTPLVYEFRDGSRLLYVSRDMLDHMYTLGMAYQLTGEQKYVNRAWADLESVCSFPDWNPAHSLDTAEMTAAVAIGYDWMYSGLSESQRKVIEKGLYNLSFSVAVPGYQDGTQVSVLQDGNWNVIINSGFTLGALALMDVYPEISSLITSGAVRAVEGMLIEFGPDGAWKEGPNYWEYTMQYAAKMLSSLDSVFETCFSLDKCEGLSTAGNYILHVQSDMGLFNYGDANASHYYVPEIFYLADKYENSELMTTLLTVNHGEMLDCEDVALSLLWYDDAKEDTSELLPLDGIYWTEGIATFRDVWSDGATAFAGIHGGKTNVMHSQIDGGTFVYDYAGVRWAREIGMTPYSTSVTSDRSEGSGRWLLYNSKAEAHNTLVINPDGTAEQAVSSTAKTLRFENDNKGGIAVLDLTENYAANASSAIRGIFFTDDRTSLVVRDEVTLLKENSAIYWFMQTDAAVEIAEDGKSATLTQDGKQVILDFVTSGNGTATLSYGTSTRDLLGTTSPLAGTAEEAKDADHPDINRIAIKLEGASGAVTITVKLTPVGVNSTPVSDYDTSFANWKIPEGEIAAKPEIQSVVIDGRTIEFDDANQATFLSVEGTYDTVPTVMVTVDDTKFTYEVTEATTTDGGIATIVVRDKANSNVMTTYTIVYEEIPKAAVPEGFTGTALQVISAAASAEPEASAGNVAWKVLDQNTGTSWTSQGMGNWILLELEEEATVDNLIIWFKNGNTRNAYFNVSVSADGENFEMVYSGESGGSAIGTTEAYEQFALGGKTAKYVKIGCNGSSKGVVSGWNNIAEIVFTGTVKETEATPTPVPSAAPTATPAPSAEPTTSPTPEAVESVAEKTDEDYMIGSNGTVTIYCTGELDEFIRVEVDGVEVDKSNYTLEEGSTILTFKTSYLDTLTVGEHTVKMIYTEGRSAATILTIKAKTTTDDSTISDNNAEDEVTNEVSDDSTAETDVGASAAPTGDSNHFTLWVVLAFAACIGGIIYGMIYYKKSK